MRKSSNFLLLRVTLRSHLVLAFKKSNKFCRIQVTKTVKIKRCSLHEKCPYSVLFWSLFSRTSTQYWEIRIQPKCRKIRNRIIPHTDTFNAVVVEDPISLRMATNIFLKMKGRLGSQLMFSTIFRTNSNRSFFGDTVLCLFRGQC